MADAIAQLSRAGETVVAGAVFFALAMDLGYRSGECEPRIEHQW
jgi:hypothetical protein